MSNSFAQDDALIKALTHAIEAGDSSILGQLIDDQKDHEETLADALAICCENGHHGVAHYLLSTRKANPNKPSMRSTRCKGIPPLILAVRNYQRASAGHSDPQSGRGSNATPGGSITTEPNSDSSSEQLDIDTDTIATIRMLFKHGASLAATDPDKKTALSHINHHHVAKVLLEGREETDLRSALDQKNNEGYDALSWILCQEGTSPIAILLIEYGADIKAKDGHGRTTLMTAVWRNHVDVVRRLVTEKDIVCETDKRGRNIWHHVASDGEQLWGAEMIEILTSNIGNDDVDVNAPDPQGRNYLHYNAIWGKDDMTKALRDAGRFSDVLAQMVDKHTQKTPLHFAAQFGKVELVKWLLAHGADVKARCKDKSTPLHLACGYGADTANIVPMLLPLLGESDVRAQTDNKLTPLHIAAYHGQIATVRSLLLKAPGLEVNAICEGGWTPLHLACAARPTYPTMNEAVQAVDPRKYQEVVHELLSHKADVNKKSRASRTALHLAAGSCHADIVEQLLDRDGIRIPERDSQGNTPIVDAARSDSCETTVPLLAPWREQHIKSLPQEIRQVANLYDADIVDIGKQSGELRRFRLPVYNLIYHDHGDPGMVTREHVSTKPASPGSFRWIHLPSNNLSWCHTLLTKQFIENDCPDVKGFKALERSLSQQQYRGQKPHALHMRPFCQRLPKRSEDYEDLQKKHESPHTAPSHHSTRTNTDQSIGQHGSAAAHLTGPALRTFAGIHPHPLRSDTNQSLERQESPTAPSHAILPSFLGPDSMGLYSHTSGKQKDRDGSGEAPVNVQRLVQPSSRALDRVPREPVQDSNFTACLFMPYLDLETRQGVLDLSKQRSSKTSDSTVTLAHGAGKSADSNSLRDEQLHQAYRASNTNDFLLHTRRTLDQFWYKSIDTSYRDDDQVLGRYQKKHQERDKTAIDILMVDQLWIWVLGSDLIVTSFPQKWGQPREETPSLLSSVFEDLSSSGTPVHSVHELAICIVGHCLSASDRVIDRASEQSVFKTFNSTVGIAKELEVELFREFKDKAKAASNEVKNMEHPDGAPKPNKVLDAFVDSLLDIHRETVLLEEVKDIRDELGILTEILNDQKEVLREMPKAFGNSLSESKVFINDPRAADAWIEQDDCLHQYRVEIKGMSQQADGIYQSITDLLDHKQKHANVLEARYARNLAHNTARQADSTARAGQRLMVITIATASFLPFLPMSFLAAFFAIDIKEMPHNEEGEQALSLSFVMRYVVGLGLGAALVIVAVAWFTSYEGILTRLTNLFKGLSSTKHAAKEGTAPQDKATKRSGHTTSKSILGAIRRRSCLGDEEKRDGNDSGTGSSQS